MASRFANTGKSTDGAAADDAALQYTGSNVFPDYPRERVNTKQNKDFWDAMDTILDGHETFGHLERGILPSAWLKFELVDTDGLTALSVPAQTNARYTDIVKHNTSVAKVICENSSRTMQLTAATETANRALAAQIQASLRVNAPLLLASLLQQCTITNLMGSDLRQRCKKVF